MSAITSPGFAERQPARLTASLASPWTTFALIVIAIGQQVSGHLDCDVSWFITFAEKFLDGAVPYVDVTDPNPPASFLVLTPAIMLARAYNVAVEPVVAGLVFLFGVLSIAVSVVIFRYGAPRSREDWGLVLNASVFTLLVVPALVFAEREHIALLAFSPMLATLAASAEGGRVPRALRIVAGLGAGLAVCFKPFFALAVMLPALALAFRERSPRLLLTVEMAAAGGLCAVYAVATFVFFPGYARYAMPVIADIYQPARDTLANLAFFTLAPFNVALLAALFIVSAKGFAHPPVAPGFVAPAAARVCAFASIGFLVSFFLQGKGWSNHAYPGIVLALLAWCFFALDGHPRARAAREGRLFKFVFIPALLAAPFLFGAFNVLADVEEHPGLRAEIARVAPSRPRLIVMARQLDYGHPVTRQLNGAWVGRPNALWTASLAAYLLRDVKDPVWRARVEDYRRRDLVGFVEDVRVGKPDVIVVEDKDTREWVVQQPESATILDGYEKTGAAEEIEIWTRRAP
ncbi:hypothetical protein [Methylocystis parvus]|uniref:DUF2029 domain-containing protein n=1 Tax=Methylocystis parvus TaxID=134 RepID=A0A6B8MAJ2_9HYPH|nr:hypothetical protein [Methylocystis parvus]QGM98303.1 hypothetical protein F7D14_13005 [Methylocystis parvus]WBK01369.1 hypothetical protein MMG94_06570 [Methylocystis parvus OBBP]